MPSLLHEALLVLFRNRPELAPELLSGALGVDLPSFTEARVESAELSDVVPRELRADLIILLLNGEPVAVIIVEAQLSRDPKKRVAWPTYLVGAYARYRCPAYLLVVTTDEGLAAWCAQPIHIGHPGLVLRPLVLGPGAVPVVTEAAQAEAMPELSVLSAIAHGKGDRGLAVAIAAIAAARGLDAERATLYDDLVLFWLNEAARKRLEELMEQGRYEYQSEMVRRHVAQGMIQGEIKGRLEAKAQAVLTVLEARGLSVTSELRKRVLECTDPDKLDRWIQRAAVAVAPGELLDEPAP